MATVTMTLEEYEAMAALIRNRSFQNEETSLALQEPKTTVKRKSTPYQRKYKRAFKKIAPKYKLKSGKWKKGGFKKAVKAAHKEAKI